MAHALPSLDSMRQRRDMVRRQVAARGLHDPVLLTAMGEVPREAFVLAGMQEFAYDDSPLPLQQGQTISQPYIVARMIDAAALTPDDSVLEVGTGSGYAAAVMSRIADRVYSIERHAELAETAARRLQDLGYDNVEVRHGDGTEGWPEAAPFDAILVAAAGAAVPDALRRQLAVGGRLVMPVGDVDIQSLRLVMRTGEDSFEERPLGAVRFVPLIAGGEAVAAGDAAPRATDPVALIRAAAEPLPDFDDPAFGALFDRFADARVVLLGEASHGTSEFYRARAAITRHLITRHGFNIV
ncbi:MAG TPA: protein-L-isoaspartate(D-aspartate) O-methyltransferase, partial [Rhodanobacteraceae bacterium]|nr:protein-L-isoaspartate(D-aspartate) O-methyltransferase [Rhodanobacteraceae bacterium]